MSTIEQHTLYAPTLTRASAEAYVRETRRPTLRKSSIANHYALTVLHTSNTVAHYLIQQRPTSCAVVSETGQVYREFTTTDDMLNAIAPSYPSQPVEENPQ